MHTPRPSRLYWGPLILLLASVAGCAPGTATPGVSPGATAAPSASATAGAGVEPSPTSPPTAAPAPSGVLAFPTEFAVELGPGTYWSSPPFDLGFAFEIDESGWRAGHLNQEFFDIQQFEAVPGENLPTRIVAFAHPLDIHGSTIVPAEELTPTKAVDLWVDRTDVDAGNVTQLDLLGGDAVSVDLHAPVPMIPLFGGDDGTFRLDSATDARLAAVQVDDGLLFLIALAPPDELDAAWAQALPIFESIKVER